MSRFVLGLDVGSRMTKGVLVDEGRNVLGRARVPTGAFFVRAADQAADGAIAKAGARREAVAYTVTTGYGRARVPTRDLQVTEITCHAYGAATLFPRARTVLDIGAQNSRAIGVTPEGRVSRFRMNEKCASGAGRFLERVARALEVELDQIGPLSLRGTEPKPISSICAVLAESEVINLVSQECRIEDILAGAHQCVAERIMTLARQVGLEPEVALTGGVAANPGMVRALQERLGMPLLVHADSEFAGAIGAAMLGMLRLERLGQAGRTEAGGTREWRG